MSLQYESEGIFSFQFAMHIGDIKYFRIHFARNVYIFGFFLSSTHKTITMVDYDSLVISVFLEKCSPIITAADIDLALVENYILISEQELQKLLQQLNPSLFELTNDNYGHITVHIKPKVVEFIYHNKL